MAKKDDQAHEEKQEKKPKKKRWYSYLVDAYKIVKEEYSWAPIAIWGSVILFIVLGVLLGYATGSWAMWIVLGIGLAIVVPMLILVALVKRASYRRIDGMPGAASAVLSNIKRGWSISEEPVRFNAKTQDMIFRAIGRPGVVLIADGDPNRVNKLINEERRAIKRVAPSAPVEVIKVGNGEGLVSLIDLEKTMKRLPKKISNEEVAAVAKRLDAVQTNSLPIPKGVDPFNARPDRRGMRGR